MSTRKVKPLLSRSGKGHGSWVATPLTGTEGTAKAYFEQQTSIGYGLGP